MTENLLEWQLKDRHLKWYQTYTSTQLSPAVEISPTSFLPLSIVALSTWLSSFLPALLPHEDPFALSNRFQAFSTILHYHILFCSFYPTNSVIRSSVPNLPSSYFLHFQAEFHWCPFSKWFLWFFFSRIGLYPDSSFFLNPTNDLRAQKSNKLYPLFLGKSWLFSFTLWRWLRLVNN